MARVTLSDEIARRAEHFTGRRWVLDVVSDWMTQGDERFLLVTGEPGSGKTALAAWLAGAGPAPDDPPAAARLERVRDAWQAAHFCVGEDRHGSLNPGRFTRSLSQQLADRHDRYALHAVERIAPAINIHLSARENWGRMIGLQIENFIVNTNAQDLYNLLMREPLEALLQADPALKLFILVDSLDEALAFGRPNVVTLLAGSNDLPAGVRFLVTSRNEPRVIDQIPNCRRLNLSAPEHAADAESDLRAYVTLRLAGSDMQERLEADASSDALGPTLVAHAEGNFLYARFLLDEIAAGARAADVLEGLPRGLFGLYRSHLDHLLPEMLEGGASTRWVDRLQPLLGSLSVAMPAAPLTTLPDWLQRGKGEVVALLGEVVQITEFEPAFGGAYRLYHRSVADFLDAMSYQENGTPALNRYYTPLREQHDRIIDYYLEQFASGWEECDDYGLLRLASHLQASLAAAEKPRERRQQAAKLYDLVLDGTFRGAQRDQLKDVTATMADLRAALNVALARGDLLPALRCVAAYRETNRGEEVSTSLFEAVGAREFDRALQRAAHYSIAPKPAGRWARVLRYYLAWEAAESGRPEESRRILESSEPMHWSWAERLCDALLVRTAHAQARGAAGAVDARTWLEALAPTKDPDWLLQEFAPAGAPGHAEQQQLLDQIEPRLHHLERLARDDHVDAEELADLFANEERRGEYAAALGRPLARLAAAPAGRSAIDRALRAALPNPYPEYRDVALIELGVAALACPNPAWTRERLQELLRTTLDKEGITYTFDLPAILSAEAGRRGLPAPALDAYLDEAGAAVDRWGTRTRLRTAHAAALHWQGRTDDAFAELVAASREPPGFAGFASEGWLALATRCHELGRPEAAHEPIWGEDGDVTLLDQAWEFAGRVRNPAFRDRRLELVDRYAQTWWDQEVAGIEEVRAELATLPDPDARRTFKDLVAARWVSPLQTPNLDGLRALVPMALADGTLLDHLLGRLLGVQLRDLHDDVLAGMIPLCATGLATARHWKTPSPRP